MGWTSFSMREPIKEWFKKSWDYENSDYEVIDSALVNRSNLYGAVRKKSTGDVFCAVFLIRWAPKSDYNFSYKDMTEHVGPNVYDCPKKIMKLLTPLTDENDINGYAGEWRNRVEKYWANRDLINSGVVLKTPEPIKFRSGDEYQYFKKIGRTIWAGIMIENEFRNTCRVRINLSHYNIEKITEENLAVS